MIWWPGTQWDLMVAVTQSAKHLVNQISRLLFSVALPALCTRSAAVEWVSGLM